MQSMCKEFCYTRWSSLSFTCSQWYMAISMSHLYPWIFETNQSEESSVDSQWWKAFWMSILSKEILVILQSSITSSNSSSWLSNGFFFIIIFRKSFNVDRWRRWRHDRCREWRLNFASFLIYLYNEHNEQCCFVYTSWFVFSIKTENKALNEWMILKCWLRKFA